jgi:hypothetical protein
VTTPMRRVAFDQFFVRAAVAKVWPAPSSSSSSAPASGPPSAPPPSR